MSVVIVRLIGGLGNQMFQYAAGRSIAERHCVPLLLDTADFSNYGLRRYELDDLSITARVASEEQLEKLGVLKANQNPGLLKRALNRIGVFRPAAVLSEASFSYDARVEDIKPPIYLDGYWQSEKYFAGIARTLREEFTIHAGLDRANAEIADEISSAGECAVSLHIRRGDYVTNPQAAQFHGVCSLDYYRAAIKYISGHIQRPHFFVFSDDHDWVSANLDIGSDVTLVTVNGPDRGVLDMGLMKACRHHIIANSSFSWWGAWLNPRSEKIVIAPKRWFNQSSHDTRDLLPSEWVTL